MITTRRCSHCKEEKPEKVFTEVKGKFAGRGYRNSWCNSCRAAQRRGDKPVRRNSVIVDGAKLCMECFQFSALYCFSPDARGKGGVAAYCKPCKAKRDRCSPQRKERAVTYAAKYRQRHRERYLSQHRLHQFKRRHQIVVTSDGTVTDKFLKELYATENCFYCKKVIPVGERTLEHLVPLIAGGLHTATNLTMACKSCNCAKLNFRTL